jgi:hypothetical protein
MLLRSRPGRNNALDQAHRPAIELGLKTAPFAGLFRPTGRRSFTAETFRRTRAPWTPKADSEIWPNGIRRPPGGRRTATEEGRCLILALMGGRRTKRRANSDLQRPAFGPSAAICSTDHLSLIPAQYLRLNYSVFQPSNSIQWAKRRSSREITGNQSPIFSRSHQRPSGLPGGANLYL